MIPVDRHTQGWSSHVGTYNQIGDEFLGKKIRRLDWHMHAKGGWVVRTVFWGNLASSLEEVEVSTYFVVAQFETRLFLFWKLNVGVIYIGVDYIILCWAHIMAVSRYSICLANTGGWSKEKVKVIMALFSLWS